MRLALMAAFSLLAIGLLGCDTHKFNQRKIGQHIYAFPRDAIVSGSQYRLDVRVGKLRPDQSGLACDGRGQGSGYSLYIRPLPASGPSQIREKPDGVVAADVAPFDGAGSLSLEEAKLVLEVEAYSGGKVSTFSDGWPLLSCGPVNTCAVGFRVGDLGVVATCGFAWTPRPGPKEMRVFAGEVDAALRRWRVN